MTGILRKAIADSGLPMLTLAQRTGLVRQSLMRFAAGESSLRLDLADKLAAYFGLELKLAARRPGKGVKHGRMVRASWISGRVRNNHDRPPAEPDSQRAKKANRKRGA
jgi:hypothetical protein